MNFVKTNLYLIICGVVVLLAIGACFWPLGSWKEELQGDMNTRIGKVTDVKNLTQTKITVIPGGTPIAGPVVEKVLQAREKAQQNMKEQQIEIARMASGQNQANRATVEGSVTVPWLGGKKQPGYLPVLGSDMAAHRYKDAYLVATGAWPGFLANNTQIVAAAPTLTEVQAAMDAYEKARILEAPTFHGDRVPDAPGIVGASSAEKVKYMKEFVTKRASSIRMYVTIESFDRAPWASDTGAPDEAQIFESLVRCWLQQDVVNAIAAVNGSSINVGQSPIKRLASIKVGSDAAGGSATLFQVSAAGAGPGGRPVAGAPVEPFRTMTGRVSTTEYDVVTMTVTMVIDPAKINTFIQQLYLQNNAYTILNVKQSTVDPFQAASEGYLYGETQCVLAEIQIEGLLFRKWTVPLMPAAIKTQLGVVAAK